MPFFARFATDEYVKEVTEELKCDRDPDDPLLLAVTPFTHTIPIIYKGETKCQATYKTKPKKGQACTNNAYYLQDSMYLCGVLSKKDKRTDLTINPMKKQNEEAEIARRTNLVIAAMKHNITNKKKGGVRCCKLRMMEAPQHVDGYLTVFPNFKHGNRKDGHGVPECSPMSLGPVVHKQPGLPDALNLENFWQGSKCLKSELLSTGYPGPDFYKTQIDMLKDKIPHRHKPNKGEVAYFVWKGLDSQYKYFDYVSSRQFYCTFYQRLCSMTYGFKDLMYKRDRGVNILIAGYDGGCCEYDDVEYDELVKEIETCYLDGSKPFGHEMCLLTMLLLNKEDYPWIKYKTEEF